MATLPYKLEYVQKPLSDPGVMMHIRSDVPAYQDLISREDYFAADNTVNQTAFITSLFYLPGVVQVSSKAYRVYVEKSPVYTWNEVLGPLFSTVSSATSHTGTAELAASGITLESITERRQL